MTDTYISIPNLKVREGSGFTATARFVSGKTATAPTTVKYRVDCLTTNKTLTDWTSASAAASVSISITPTENAIQDESNAYETKQLTVAADPDLSTQTREVVTWKVINNKRI